MLTVFGEEALAGAVAGALPEIPKLVHHFRLAPPPQRVTGVVVVQVPNGAGAGFLADVGDLMSSAPAAAVMAAVSPAASARSIMGLGGLGLSEVLKWPRAASPEAWNRSVRECWAAAVGDLVWRNTQGLDATVRDALVWATRHGRRSPRPADLAAGVGLSVRTLQRRCRGRTSPARLLRLGRLLQGCHRLSNTDLSVERIALTSGFAGSVGFRRALGRVVERTPSELRVECGVTEILAALRSWGRSGAA